MFYHATNTLEKTVVSYSNTVNNKSRNFILFRDNILKSLRMKEFNKYLNGGIADFKPFPGSKSK